MQPLSFFVEVYRTSSQERVTCNPQDLALGLGDSQSLLGSFRNEITFDFGKQTDHRYHDLRLKALLAVQLVTLLDRHESDLPRHECVAPSAISETEIRAGAGA